MQHRMMHTLAVAAAVAASFSPDGSARAAFAAPSTLAMPKAPDETVYRPECPGDEVTGIWLKCQMAHAAEPCNQR